MISIVSFSSRKAGNCDKTSNYIASNIPNSTIFSFSEFDIHPCGGCHYECFTSREKCPYFADIEYTLIDTICHSEFAYFIIPNYCDYPCANFFIFNERSQCYFQGHPELLDRYLDIPKKFIVISNTGKEHFGEAFIQHTSSAPEILFIRPKSFGKVSIQGDLLPSEEVSKVLNQFLEINTLT